MSLINVKRCKEIVKEHGKVASREYLDQLEYKLRELIYRSIRNCRACHKRLKSSELL